MERVKHFLKNNIVVFIWAALAIFIELFSVHLIGEKPYLTSPLYPLIVFSFLLCLLFLVRNIWVKAIFCVVFLILQAYINLGFIYLYDSNGTFFEWAMINQRSDAKGTIEDLSLRWGWLIALISIIICYAISVFIVWITMYREKRYKYRANNTAFILTAVAMVLCLGFIVGTPTVNALANQNESYVQKYLYGSGENRYHQVGICSNTFYEFFNGTIANAVTTHSPDGLEDYIYNNEDPLLETSEYFGISKNNNLVYILVESWEWYPFLAYKNKPQLNGQVGDGNGRNDYYLTEELARELYPNLYTFMDESVYATNFYSREKTDTAENLALLSSNPTGEYTNYDFSDNSYPHSLPNMFRNSVEKNGNTLVQLKSFHQNTGEFYNRNALHASYGFDDLVDINDMKPYGVVNHWEDEGERTLDSETMDKMQDMMFPQTQEGEQFMTFWLTFSMHGYYVERENLKHGYNGENYYQTLDEHEVYPAGLGTKADYLRTYAATVMDFDRAVGIMLRKLEIQGQLDNTTIVMFADHNTYYNNLSYFAKDIDERYNSELYRVPFMIKDSKLVKKYQRNNKGSREITKFTTTSDMLPTILDLFGIHGYRNLYFGQTMFGDKESIIFSRAYGIFVTDKVICYSAKNLLYKSAGFTNEDYDNFIARAELHLNKLENIDKIFYNNWFETHPYIPITS